MNISEFEKPANEKLAKINEALDTLYGFRVYDTIDIKKLYDVKKDLKTKLAELEASLPFNTANTNPKYMKHVLLAEAIDNMIEAKKKDHDNDGDIDSDDYMAARDKAIKKAMGKDKKDESVKEELTDKQKKLPPALQKAIAKKQGDKPKDKVEEKVNSLKALLEQEVEKAEIVIAAKSLVDELQDMIEQMGKMQNDELGAVVDQMSYQYGADKAASFNQAVASQLETLLASIKSAKEAVNNEVLVLTGEAPAPSDMGPADSDLGDMETDADDGQDLEAPVDDLTGGDDSASGPEEDPLGRAKKA
tara:strand:+ start:1704 stop:2615 length:912 start_codon:yes stop_codon:yes gene_type:complete